MNIKSLPTQYVLKRWTREARSGTIQDSHGREIIENPRLDKVLRYKDMTHKFLNLTHRAASHPGCTLLVHNTLDLLSKQVEEEITGCTNNVEAVTVPMNITPSNDVVSAARLKQKEVQTKTSKRKRTWLDKKRKFAKKGNNKKDKGSAVCTCTKNCLFYFNCTNAKMFSCMKFFILFYWKAQEITELEQETIAVQDIPPSTSGPNEGMIEPYLTINSFSQLLMVISLGDDFSCPQMCKDLKLCSFILQGESTGDPNADF
jgi:hypothetical protein